MIRLFSAISISDDVSQKLNSISTPFDGVRWLEPHSLHCTLVFMGDVNVYLYRQIRQQLVSIEFKPFSFQLKGLETFTNEKRQAHVLTAKIEPSDALTALQKECGQLISMFHPNLKLNLNFKPHVTLARLNHLKLNGLDEFVNYHKETSFGQVQVDAFHLFSSRLTPTGSVYTRLETYQATKIESHYSSKMEIL